MPWCVGIPIANGLGGFNRQSSFPACGPLPRSIWLNRQVVQLAIIFYSLLLTFDQQPNRPIQKCRGCRAFFCRYCLSTMLATLLLQCNRAVSCFQAYALFLVRLSCQPLHAKSAPMPPKRKQQSVQAPMVFRAWKTLWRLFGYQRCRITPPRFRPVSKRCTFYRRACHDSSPRNTSQHRLGLGSFLQ